MRALFVLAVLAACPCVAGAQAADWSGTVNPRLPAQAVKPNWNGS